MSTHTRPTAIVLPAQAGGPPRLPTPTAAVAQRRKLRVQGLPQRTSHRKVQFHFNGPIPHRSPAAAKVWVQGLPQRTSTARCSSTSTAQSPAVALPPQRCGCRACPALFPFVDFAPFLTGADGPRSARALADTVRFPLSTFSTPPNRPLGPSSGSCLADTVRFPLSTFSTPPNRPLGPSSGPCLADTTCLPLSTCPSRYKPNLESVSSGTEEGKRCAAQFKAIQTARLP